MALGLGANAANNMFNAELHTGSTFTAPTQWWIKFHLGDPGAAGTSNPASNTTRYQVTFGTMSAGVTSNSALVSLQTIAQPTVPATENYTHCSIWTASSGGSLIGTGAVQGGSVTIGTIPTIAAGALTITVNLAA